MIATFTRRMSFAHALKSRSYALVWTGQTISNLGDGIFNVALAWQILLMTHSGTSMGLVLIASMVPRLVFVLIGGVTADRLSRRMIVLWSDGGRGLIVLLISILGFTGHLQLWHLVVESLLFGMISGFFNPAIMAIVPDLVEKEHLTSANTLTSFSSNLAQFFGPMLGALLIALFTPMGAFLANSFSFFFSVAFLIFVRVPERHAAHYKEKLVETSDSASEAKETPAKRRGFRGVIADIQEGLTYVRNLRWLWVTIVALAFGNIGYMATLAVAMPKLVNDVYGQGAWLLGLISTTSAIGSILALVFVGQAKRMKKRGLLGYLALGLTCVGMLIFGLPFPPAVAPMLASLASTLVGFGLAFFNTIWFTILYETIPNDKLGRVISLDTLGSFAMIPVGYLLGGIMTDSIGPATVFIFFSIFNAAFVLIPLCVRDIRELQ